MNPSFRGLILLLPVIITGQPSAAASPADESGAPFEIRDGRIHLPGWDDGPTTTVTVELLKIRADSFVDTVKVERNLVVVEDEPAMSKPVTIPTHATELFIRSRSQPESGIFPLIRVMVRPLNAQENDPRTQVYETRVQTVSLGTTTMPIPAELQGTAVRISFTMLNPSPLNDKRVYYFSQAVFRGYK